MEKEKKTTNEKGIIESQLRINEEQKKNQLQSLTQKLDNLKEEFHDKQIEQLSEAIGVLTKEVKKKNNKFDHQLEWRNFKNNPKQDSRNIRESEEGSKKSFEINRNRGYHDKKRYPESRPQFVETRPQFVERRNYESEKRCYNCQKLGHLAKNCFYMRNKKTPILRIIMGR